jgi:hypothetical protein
VVLQTIHLHLLLVQAGVFQLLAQLVQQVAEVVGDLLQEPMVALEEHLVLQGRDVLQKQVDQVILHQQLHLKEIMQEQLTIIQLMHKEAVVVLLQSEEMQRQESVDLEVQEQQQVLMDQQQH